MLIFHISSTSITKDTWRLYTTPVTRWQTPSQGRSNQAVSRMTNERHRFTSPVTWPKFLSFDWSTRITTIPQVLKNSIDFFFAIQRTLPTKKRQKLLTIPLTLRYLYYLLYNTSLEYNSYTTFTVCTPIYLANYNAEQVSAWPQVSYYYCSWQRYGIQFHIFS